MLLSLSSIFDRLRIKDNLSLLLRVLIFAFFSFFFSRLSTIEWINSRDLIPMYKYYNISEICRRKDKSDILSRNDRAPTMAEHYSKPSRRDEQRKLIFGASYFRPGRRERRPERRNARAHARKPWEKILAPTSCANSSSFEASHPPPFSHPSLYLIDRWNVISLLSTISIYFV